MKDHEYEGWGMTIARALALAVGLALLAWMCDPTTASAHNPYGGCAESWQAPRSWGAEHCRDHGWTVRKRVTVSPRAMLRHSTLPECRHEDGSGQGICLWDGLSSGNGRGLAYWINAHDRQRFVWTHDPAEGPRWRWVRRSMADALAEGDGRRATTRPWRRCVVNERRGLVRCPNGDRVRY